MSKFSLVPNEIKIFWKSIIPDNFAMYHMTLHNNAGVFYLGRKDLVHPPNLYNTELAFTDGTSVIYYWNFDKSVQYSEVEFLKFLKLKSFI